MEYLSVLLSSFAVAVAVITFILVYILPAKFKIEHITKTPKAKVANTCEHIITIVNIRNKTGILKGMEPKTLSKKAGVIREKVEIIWSEKTIEIQEDSPYAVVAVGPKESIVIKCYVTIIDSTKRHIIPEYKIKLTLDEKTKFIYDEEDKNLEIGYTF